MRSQEEINSFLKDLATILNNHKFQLNHDCLLIDKKNDNNLIGYLEGSEYELRIVSHEDEVSVIVQCLIEDNNKNILNFEERKKTNNE